MMPYLIYGFSAFFISLLGTRLVILALRQKTILMDKPNFRSNHKTPTPRGGGIAVVFALVIGLTMAGIQYHIILALLLLAAVSLLDDLIQVPALVRLLVHVLAVALPLSTMPDPLFGGLLPQWLDTTITAILWVWFINLFNFMDGIDGISAAEMTFIGIGICVITAFTGLFPSPLFSYCLIIVCAGFGFMWWNWHPAKIFLGDVGSVPIGFILGYVLLLMAKTGHGYAYAAMILPAYYIADSGITLARRLWRKEKIWQAHSSHYYQIAVRNGRSHSKVVTFIMGINLLMIQLAFSSVQDPEFGFSNVCMAYLTVATLLGYFSESHKHAKS